MVVRPLVKSEEELIDGIRSGDDHVLKLLYARCYPAVLRLVTQNSGTETEAEDMFQDAMVVLHRNVGKGMELSCQVKTYLYSVSRRLWLKELSKRKHAVRVKDSEMFIELSADAQNDIGRSEKQYEVMSESLSALGEPCAELLKQFYLEDHSMTDIAESFGYTNADNAKNQKYKCLQRLKKIFFQRLNNSDE